MINSKIKTFRIENDIQLEITRKKIIAIQKLLLEMKRTVPYQQYLEMSEAFLADIKRMEEEIHQYLKEAPASQKQQFEKIDLTDFLTECHQLNEKIQQMDKVAS
ncbi:hypothetical protein FJZ31_34430 [Candidatus Poribacteria bacterium]|nr:hypothetical protein [Candidatus Poribacteria bacterium]